MTILIYTGVINVVADFVLVGIFKMGVAGAAIATIAAQAISAYLATRKISIHSLRLMESQAENLESYVEDKYKNKKKKPFLYPEIKKVHIMSMVMVGFPLALKSTLFPIANSIIQAVINTQGTVVIAAVGVCGTLDLLIWLIADSVGGSLSTFVAQNMGAGKKKRAYQGSMIGTFITMGSIMFVSLILRFGTGFLGTLFISPEDAAVVIPVAVHIMKIYTPFFFFYGMYAGFSGACCGTGKTLAPMVITMTCTCGLRVLAILFIYPIFNTADCIFWIYVASWIASGLGSYALFYHRFKSWRNADE